MHLFVALSNMISLAQSMKDVNGVSSRFVSETLQPGRWFAWQPNYGAFSVSAGDKKTMIAYVENQKQHHSQGSCWAEVEETFEEEDV